MNEDPQPGQTKPVEPHGENVRPEVMADSRLLLRFDGTDEQRLTRILRNDIFLVVLSDLLKHLYWWSLEGDDEQGKAYRASFEFVQTRLVAAGLDTAWRLDGRVTTRDGRTVDKTAADAPEARNVKPAQTAHSVCGTL